MHDKIVSIEKIPVDLKGSGVVGNGVGSKVGHIHFLKATFRDGVQYSTVKFGVLSSPHAT